MAKRMVARQKALVRGCSGLALGAAVIVAMAAPAAAADSTAAPAATGTDLDQGAIIVTARKRSERLQDVPLTIQVLSGDALSRDGVLRPRELQFAVPGFYVQNFETRATIAMRGVGAEIAGGKSSVAVHVDGIYQASAAAQLDRLFDVERIEVVKGPQGTLYGRNSTGGALNILTKTAGDKFEGNLSATYGSYHDVGIDGGLSAPLGGGWGLRVAGSYLKGDGAYTNVITGKKVGRDDFAGGRATITGGLGGINVNIFAQYTRDADNRQPTLIPIVTATAQPLLGWRRTALDNPTSPEIVRKMWLAGLTLSGDFSDTVSWKSITGYLDYHDTSKIDVNPSISASALTIQTPQQARQYSQEFQLHYKNRAIDGVLGVYYLSDRETNQRILSATPPGILYYNSSGLDKTDAAAVFGDVSYNLTDKLTLGAGARINHDSIRNGYTGRALLDGTTFDLSGGQTSATWRAGAQYHFQPNVMAFFTVSTGFQSGFFQTRADSTTGAQTPNYVKPEKLTAYEVGLKLAAPGRGYFNISGFYYDYRDMQVSIGGIFLNPDGTLDSTRAPFFYTSNAGKARIYGIDAQLADVRLSPNLVFGADAEYLNARFVDYRTINNSRNPVIYDGNPLPRAPKFSGHTSLTLDHLGVGGSAEGLIKVEYSFRSRTYFDASDSRLNSQGFVGLVNASAELDFDGGKWALTASGRNLTNKKFFDFYAGGNFANTGEFRTWQIGAKVRF